MKALPRWVSVLLFLAMSGCQGLVLFKVFVVDSTAWKLCLFGAWMVSGVATLLGAPLPQQPVSGNMDLMQIQPKGGSSER